MLSLFILSITAADRFYSEKSSANASSCFGDSCIQSNPACGCESDSEPEICSHNSKTAKKIVCKPKTNRYQEPRRGGLPSTLNLITELVIALQTEISVALRAVETEVSRCNSQEAKLTDEMNELSNEAKDTLEDNLNVTLSRFQGRGGTFVENLHQSVTEALGTMPGATMKTVPLPLTALADTVTQIMNDLIANPDDAAVITIVRAQDNTGLTFQLTSAINEFAATATERLLPPNAPDLTEIFEDGATNMNQLMNEYNDEAVNVSSNQIDELVTSQNPMIIKAMCSLKELAIAELHRVRDLIRPKIDELVLLYGDKFGPGKGRCEQYSERGYERFLQC